MRISDWSSDVCSSDLDNKASRSHTVIEVNGRDRPGLLYLVTTTLTRLNLMIKSARIATYGERAVDAFYVQDPLGMKIESKQKLRAIEKKLLAALEDGECAPAPRPDRKSTRLNSSH